MERDPPNDPLKPNLRRLLQYFLSLAAVSTAVLLHLMLRPQFGTELPFITLFPAVFVIATFFGLGPAVAATVAGVLAAFQFRSGTAMWGDGVPALGALLFMLTGVGLGWLGEARLRAQSVARKALSQAQADAERAEEEAVRAEEEAARAEEQQLRAEEEAVRAEKEARHAEQQADRVERILSSFTDAFIVVDRHWLITYLNPPADALVGNTSTPHVGRLFWEVFREDPEGPFGAAFRRTLAGQDVYRGQAY